MLANRIRQMENSVWCNKYERLFERVFIQNCILCNYFPGMHTHLINSLTQLACLELDIIRFPRLVTYDNRMLISLSWILEYLESMLFCLSFCFAKLLDNQFSANLAWFRFEMLEFYILNLRFNIVWLASLHFELEGFCVIKVKFAQMEKKLIWSNHNALPETNTAYVYCFHYKQRFYSSLMQVHLYTIC